MTDDATPATWRFNLRGTTNDKAILQRVVDAHAAMHIPLSLNEALLILIRRAATPDADTQEEAREVIEHHQATCTHGCSKTTFPPRCPEGWRVYDAYQRVIDRHRPTDPQPLPQPSPTGIRRYLGLERKAG